MTRPTAGVLTIGQSPCKDVTPSIQKILGKETTIIEAGGLDSVKDENMSSVSPGCRI